MDNYPSVEPKGDVSAALRVEGCELPKDIEALVEALVGCHELWRRSPGAGRWPFAADAPWHLMQRSAAEGDYTGDGIDGVSTSARPRPALDAAEVAQRDRVTAWLDLLTDPGRRTIVWEATAWLHKGNHGPEGRVEWGELKRRLGYARTPRRMAQVYREALAEVVGKLNGWPRARWRRLAA